MDEVDGGERYTGSELAYSSGVCPPWGAWLRAKVIWAQSGSGHGAIKGGSEASQAVRHERTRGLNGGGRTRGNQAPLREGCEDEKRVSAEKVSMVYDCSSGIYSRPEKKGTKASCGPHNGGMEGPTVPIGRINSADTSLWEEKKKKKKRE